MEGCQCVEECPCRSPECQCPNCQQKNELPLEILDSPQQLSPATQYMYKLDDRMNNKSYGCLSKRRTKNG